MCKLLKTLSFLVFMLPVIATAGQSSNTGRVLFVGKIITAGNEGVCEIKVEDATFSESCPTATYQMAYFSCSAGEGKDILSIALAAYMGNKPVKITSDGCSDWGSSVANVKGIRLE